MQTHYVPALHRSSESGIPVAVCDAVVSITQHAIAPTCQRCAAWLEGADLPHVPVETSGSLRDQMFRAGVEELRTDRGLRLLSRVETPIVIEMRQTAKDLGVIDALHAAEAAVDIETARRQIRQALVILTGIVR